jgi:hypothetical protein
MGCRGYGLAFWVDGGLGFGLGMVVEPWVWVAVGLPWVLPWVWVAVGLEPWVLSTVKKIEMRREKRKMKREKKS